MNIGEDIKGALRNENIRIPIWDCFAEFENEYTARMKNETTKSAAPSKNLPRNNISAHVIDRLLR